MTVPLLDQPIAALQDRTDAKLRYARIHLDELRSLETLRGDDFERAHQESFLHHLFDSKAAFVQEINRYYGVDLPAERVTPGAVQKALEKRGQHSTELATIYELESECGSWLSDAKAMRNHISHRAAVPRTFNIGGERSDQVNLHHPVTGALDVQHYPDRFEQWLTQMTALLVELRASAIASRATPTVQAKR